MAENRHHERVVVPATQAQAPDLHHPMNEPRSAGFFARRWHGRLRLGLLFWRDMIGVGSLVNLAASVAALIAAASGAPPGVAIALHFATLPYNVFLFLAVWRNGLQSPLTRLAALVWLVVASVL